MQKKLGGSVFDKVFESLEVFLEGLAAGLSDGERGVWLASDESFLTLDIAQLFEGAGVAGEVAVGEREERLEGGEIDALVYHQHRHDAEARFAFESLVDAVESWNHDLLFVIRGTCLIDSVITTRGLPVFEGEEDAENDVPKAEAEEPEEDGVVDEEAVDDAEDNLNVAQQGDGGGGVVGTVDKSQAVEYQHKGGGETIVTLQQHSQAEQSAGDSRDEEMEQGSAYGLVEGEVMVLPLGFGVGHDTDGAEGYNNESEGTEDGSPGTPGGVEGEVDAPSG